MVLVGWLAQHGVNHGKVNNQNFVNLPFSQFVSKLEAKLKLHGVKLIRVEESYTSKVDHLAMEEMKHHAKYAGKRVKRGSFKSSIGITFNADVNGALGIILKCKQNSSIIATLLGSGGVTSPKRIRLGELRQQTSFKRLLEELDFVRHIF